MLLPMIVSKMAWNRADFTNILSAVRFNSGFEIENASMDRIGHRNQGIGALHSRLAASAEHMFGFTICDDFRDRLCASLCATLARRFAGETTITWDPAIAVRGLQRRAGGDDR